jgi:ABC-type multidrug transport system ATPase subunit
MNESSSLGDGPAGPPATGPARGAPVVRLHEVSKRYGDRWALRGVSFELFPGEIVGFIGPNGAGKTTLMRLIAGLGAATEGEVTVMGERLTGGSLRTPPGIGIVMEQMGFLPHLSGRANLEMLAGLCEVPSSAAIPETLGMVGLDPADRRPVRAYSLGMRQRLALAQAIMDRPRLLLLDEPTNGLDPAGIVDLRHLLTRLSREGTAIFLASHMLTEVERVCHRAMLVRGGETQKTIHFDAPAPSRVRVVVSSEKDVAMVLGSGLSAERPAGEPASPVVLVTPEGSIPDLVRKLVEIGVDVEGIGAEGVSLEEEFRGLLR